MQDEDTVEDVCKLIIKQWTEWRNRSAAKTGADDGIFVHFDSSTFPMSVKCNICISTRDLVSKSKNSATLGEQVIKVGSILANLAERPHTVLCSYNATINQRK